MVDTPKENNDEEWKDVTKACPLEKQSKRRRKGRPKSRLSKNIDNSARKKNTPVDSKDIDGMDDDAEDEQEPPPIGHWMPT